MSASPPPPPVAWESPEPQPGPAPGIEFAPHGARLVAYLIDSIIVSVVIIVPLVIGSAVLLSGTTVQGDEVTAVDPGAGAGFTVFVIVAFLIGFLYYPFFWARGGQTPGMRPFALRVVRDQDGGPIGWGSAILRLIGLWIGALVFYIGWIWVFIDKRRRGWQDLVAGTVVVRRP
jgi:uncharacterized RDD family membrane protein YckC